jgi:NADP-dependent 3-hydroxy acid dehydrogenase YdfG
MNRIKDKWALITGASSGIGQACARALASYGAQLILLARRESRLTELRKELELEHGASVRTVAIDVRDRAAILELADHLEADDAIPEILINNAGLSRGLDPIQEGSFEDWDEMIDTNIKGLLNVTRALLPQMIRRDHGHIVNLGSIAGQMVYPRGNVYNATKFAVDALSQAMNVDLLGTNIRVSSISPGAVETEFSLVRFHGDATRAATVYQGYHPLTPTDIADAICYVTNTPEHVNIQELVIMPTAQRNPYVHDRK